MNARSLDETSTMPVRDGMPDGCVPAGEPSAIRFGRFEYDLRRSELRDDDGAPIPLRPKVEVLLRHLLRAPGRLCSRDELMEAIWPTTVVTDDSLVQVVVELRTALGDRGQHLLRTVPRRGYRFEAAVERADGPAAAPPTGSDPGAARTPVAASGRRPAVAPDRIEAGPVPARTSSALDGGPPSATRRLSRRTLAAVSAAALALMLAAAAAVVQPWAPAPVHIDAEIAARSTVAIMPFAVHGHAASRGTADRVADAIAAQFATRMGMRGIGRGATAPFDGPTPPLDRLRSQLGASHVVTGLVEPATGAGGSVAVNVQLARTADGSVIWARHFEQLDRGTDALATEIGLKVVNALRVQTAEHGVGPLGSEAALPMAVELTLLGWRDLDGRRSSEDIRRARSRFEQALRVDPDSVIANDGLASSYNAQRQDRNHPLTAAEEPVAADAVERALALAPNDSTALLSWGILQIARGRADLALPAFEHANRLVPSYPYGYVLIARSLLMAGRAEEALVRIEPAFDLGREDAQKAGAAYTLAAEAALMLGDDARADDYARRAVAAMPSNPDAHAVLAAVDALAGRDEQAARGIAELRRRWPSACVSRYDESRPSTHPVYLAQRERLYAALRRAGLSDG